MFNALSIAIEYLLNTLSIRFDGTPNRSHCPSIKLCMFFCDRHMFIYVKPWLLLVIYAADTKVQLLSRTHTLFRRWRCLAGDHHPDLFHPICHFLWSICLRWQINREINSKTILNNSLRMNCCPGLFPNSIINGGANSLKSVALWLKHWRARGATIDQSQNFLAHFPHRTFFHSTQWH